MGKQDEYITLKEAAQITGYTPDYIGQLIRAGKLEGKQVYSNVAWVTTREALEEYQSHKDGRSDLMNTDWWGKMLNSPEVLVQFYTSISWIVIALLLAIILLLAYVFAVSLDNRISNRNLQEAQSRAYVE